MEISSLRYESPNWCLQVTFKEEFREKCMRSEHTALWFAALRNQSKANGWLAIKVRNPSIDEAMTAITEEWGRRARVFVQHCDAYYSKLPLLLTHHLLLVLQLWCISLLILLPPRHSRTPRYLQWQSRPRTTCCLNSSCKTWSKATINRSAILIKSFAGWRRQKVSWPTSGRICVHCTALFQH